MAGARGDFAGGVGQRLLGHQRGRREAGTVTEAEVTVRGEEGEQRCMGSDMRRREDRQADRRCELRMEEEAAESMVGEKTAGGPTGGPAGMASDGDLGGISDEGRDDGGRAGPHGVGLRMAVMGRLRVAFGGFLGDQRRRRVAWLVVQGEMACMVGAPAGDVHGHGRGDGMRRGEGSLRHIDPQPCTVDQWALVHKPKAMDHYFEIRARACYYVFLILTSIEL